MVVHERFVGHDNNSLSELQTLKDRARSAVADDEVAAAIVFGEGGFETEVLAVGGDITSLPDLVNDLSVAMPVQNFYRVIRIHCAY